MNPFDDPGGTFSVLVNDEQQHSLWPGAFPVPSGWHIVHDNDTREGCLTYVAQNWTDLRPFSAR